MKHVVGLIVLLAGVGAYAGQDVCSYNGTDITNKPDEIVEAISAQSSCYDAEKLTVACAYGSSMDVQFTDAAKTVCNAELKNNKPTASDMQLLNAMTKTCNDKWSKKSGTMYISANAFCQLDALEWIVGVTGANLED